jgi:hypothetical protein
MDELMPESYFRVCAPIFLIQFGMQCNLCKSENQVAAIATLMLLGGDADEVPDGDGILLSYLDSVPDEILPKIMELHPNYELRYSMTADTDYWMSTCSCGGHYGDHYVHREALDLVFRSPNKLKISVLLDEGDLSMNAGFTSSESLGYILTEAYEASKLSRMTPASFVEGYEDCLKTKGNSYSNPHPEDSDQYNLYERGWFQAMKRCYGNFPDIDSGEEGPTYNIDIRKI